MMLANDSSFSVSGSATSWIAFSSSKDWTLDSSSDGLKTVYVKFKDQAGNISSIYGSDHSVTLDTKKPVISGSSEKDKKSVLLLNPYKEKGSSKELSSRYTDDPKIKIKFQIGDSTTTISQYMVTSKKEFGNTTWKTYPSDHDISYTLSEGDGIKTIRAKFKDSAGNISDTYSNTITLQTSTPKIKLEKIGNLNYSSTNKTYTLPLILSKEGLGLVTLTGSAGKENKIKLAIDNIKYSDEPRLKSNQDSWKIANIPLSKGPHSIKIYSKDKADNSSDTISFTLNINPAVPSTLTYVPTATSPLVKGTSTISLKSSAPAAKINVPVPSAPVPAQPKPQPQTQTIWQKILSWFGK
jgi:hypothetical protein